jgi:VWA domain containing CoxE-like protein/FAD binding domain in molybdopterin dehydrogenase
VLAGGQSLIPAMKYRLARPSVLVDINDPDDLVIFEESDGVLRIGAMTQQPMPRGKDDARTIPIDDFLIDSFTTALKDFESACCGIRRNPRIVMLLDGSRSMADHTPAMLEFAYALCRKSNRVRLFTFSTSLLEITRELRNAPPGAIEGLGEASAGGTRIGATPVPRSSARCAIFTVDPRELSGSIHTRVKQVLNRRPKR